MEIVTISVREINILASQSFHVAREAVNRPISRSSARLENEGRVPPTLAAHEQLQRIHTSITLGGTDVLATAIRHSAGVKRSNVTAERLRLFADSATHDVVAGDDFQHAHSAIYGGDVDAGVVWVHVLGCCQGANEKRVVSRCAFLGENERDETVGMVRNQPMVIAIR
jgi:hypothetical protein